MADDHTFERFGPYLIVRVLGAGGMGRIELALRADAPGGEACVLKRLVSYGRNDDQEARFRREAMIALRLSHENIARTLRVEQIEHETCLAQEFVEGVNLSKVLRQRGKRPMPISVAVHVVGEVAKALAYAHDFQGHGIVHRDVTPENIMISFDGDVKIIDFGIARSNVDGTLTSLDTVVGRRSYIPPEAWSGKKVDRRADIYGLGVVLWEMLAARRAEDALEPGPDVTLPDLRRVDTTVPDELASIVKRALAPADDRFQTADDLRSALLAFGPRESEQRKQVAATLRDCFDVDGIRAIWTEDVEDARRFLNPRRRASIGRFRGLWRGTLISVASAMIVAAAAIAWVEAPRHLTRRSDTQQGGAAPVAVSPVATNPDVAPRPNMLIAGQDRPSPRPAQEPAGAVAGRTPAGMAPRHVLRPTPSALDQASRNTRGQELLAQGNELWLKGDVQGAMTRARDAVAAGAGAPAHILLGMALMNRQDFGAAEPELREALRLDPKNVDAQQLLALLRKSAAENKGK
jgi:predicted Ser/Thr protein kinase/tetratricopeptide (TPR) repeat protein